MRARLRRHLSYANVMATIAIFFAIGGGAYAAATINGSSIKKRTIKGNRIVLQGVSSKELKDLAVTTGKIGLGQVGTTNLADNAVTSPKIADGQVAARDLGSITTQRSSVAAPFFVFVNVTVTCPAGQRVISGGAGFTGTGLLSDSRPARDSGGGEPANGDVPNAWYARGMGYPAATTLTAYAVCIA